MTIFIKNQLKPVRRIDSQTKRGMQNKERNGFSWYRTQLLAPRLALLSLHAVHHLWLIGLCLLLLKVAGIRTEFELKTNERLLQLVFQLPK